MNDDLISREALKEEFKSRLVACNEWIEKAKDKETRIRASAVKAYLAEVIMTIDNAPTVSFVISPDYVTELQNLNKELIKQLEEAKKTQGDLADEVWKLYEKHQSHLATRVIEFGDELKDLLGKYQEGGAE